MRIRVNAMMEDGTMENGNGTTLVEARTRHANREIYSHGISRIYPEDGRS